MIYFKTNMRNMRRIEIERCNPNELLDKLRELEDGTFPLHLTVPMYDGGNSSNIYIFETPEELLQFEQGVAWAHNVCDDIYLERIRKFAKELDKPISKVEHHSSNVCHFVFDFLSGLRTRLLNE